MFAERRVGCGFDGNGLLHQSVKELPAVTGGPPVEAERELVQVVVEMRAGDGSLMRAKQPPFQQRYDAMDTRQQLRRGFLPAFQIR